jgi:hypothetical protein
MSASEDRVQEALAAHIEALELGGPEPDFSHLTTEDREKLEALIGLLDQTEGVAFGRGLDEPPVDVSASTDAGRRLLAALSDALPSAARISGDPAVTTIDVPGMRPVEGWVVGTFGGRIRVWLLDEEGALAASEEWLPYLPRVFRLLPDTTAVALVEPGLSCLIVEPEDCMPTIEVPRGSLLARRYRRPVQPAGEALSAFLLDLIPHWEPMQRITERIVPTIEVATDVRERATRAVQDQVAAGGRARKTNPKRKALTGLSEQHAAGIANLVLELHDGRVQPDALEDALRGLAETR